MPPGKQQSRRAPDRFPLSGEGRGGGVYQEPPVSCQPLSPGLLGLQLPERSALRASRNRAWKEASAPSRSLASSAAFSAWGCL